jgi:hypothetical protein
MARVKEVFWFFFFKKELLASLLDASLAQGYTAPSLG